MVLKTAAVKKVLSKCQPGCHQGGGYIYRLCPAAESITEACFDRLPLEFAFPTKHTLRFADASLDR